MRLLQKLIIAFSFLISITVSAQSSLETSAEGYYQAKTGDQYVYLFFKGEDKAYVVQSRTELKKDQVLNYQSDLSKVSLQGMVKKYGEKELVIRTNNQGKKSGVKTKATFATLRGIAKANGDLELNYSTPEFNVEKLLFQHTK